jgi:hypothetical protein
MQHATIKQTNACIYDSLNFKVSGCSLTLQAPQIAATETLVFVVVPI